MSVLADLKRRNVVRVAALYVAVGWLVLQATDVLGSLLQLPPWTGKLMILLIVAGRRVRTLCRVPCTGRRGVLTGGS